MEMINNIKVGDLVARKYRSPQTTRTGIVLRLDRWLPSGDVKAKVHFIDGSVRVLNLARLAKLNK
tara:strand:- start:177 stop:371 length:195 start_codon:yes stop_codon:yes gene_type:complete